ncbi:hypothetical protein HK405_012484, partial [Cladochytrium tenue]
MDRYSQALAITIQDQNKEISVKSAMIVGELLDMSTGLLPASWNAKVQSLPALFMSASNFSDELKRHQSTMALSYLESLSATKERSLATGVQVELLNGFRQKHFDDAHAKAARQYQRLEQAKTKVRSQMEDGHFRFISLELEKSTATKEFSKWNWDYVAELVQAIGLNSKRLDETLKGTRILRRLMTFFKPFSKQYSDIRSGKALSIYTRIGRDLLRALTSTPEGVRQLCEHRFLPEISECVEQLDPSRLETTLTGEYFILLSELGKTTEGVRVLERFKLINSFYRLTEIRSRDDLVKCLLTGFDYSRDGHERLILAKVMAAGSKQMRLFATQHLGMLARHGIEDFAYWGLPLLVTQSNQSLALEAAM